MQKLHKSQDVVNINYDEIDTRNVKKVINLQDDNIKEFMNKLNQRISDSNKQITDLQSDFKKTRESLITVKTQTMNTFKAQEKVDKALINNELRNKGTHDRIIELERSLASEFRSSNIEKENTQFTVEKSTIELLIIGDSITKFIDASKIERKSPTLAQTVCMPGGKVSDILRKIKQLEKSMK